MENVFLVSHSIPWTMLRSNPVPMNSRVPTPQSDHASSKMLGPHEIEISSTVFGLPLRMTSFILSWNERRNGWIAVLRTEYQAAVASGIGKIPLFWLVTKIARPIHAEVQVLTVYFPQLAIMLVNFSSSSRHLCTTNKLLGVVVCTVLHPVLH